MSTTPGSTIEVMPIETPATPAMPGPTETGTAKGGADLAGTLSEVMVAHPDSSVNTMAALAGITQDIPPVVDPAEPTPVATTEVATQIPEEVAPPLFRFVEQAQLALAEAKKAGASFSEEKEYQAKLDTARNKERLLMSGVHIIEIDAEIASARQDGASKDVLAALAARRSEAVQERNQVYEAVFGQIKNQAKIDNKSFGEAVDGYLLTEAQEIKKNARASLKDIEASGNTEEIALARIRLQAAEMHTDIIERKKRGRGGILAPLAIFIASFTSNMLKSTTGDLQPRSH